MKIRKKLRAKVKKQCYRNYYKRRRIGVIESGRLGEDVWVDIMDSEEVLKSINFG